MSVSTLIFLMGGWMATELVEWDKGRKMIHLEVGPAILVAPCVAGCRCALDLTRFSVAVLPLGNPNLIVILVVNVPALSKKPTTTTSTHNQG